MYSVVSPFPLTSIDCVFVVTFSNGNFEVFRNSSLPEVITNCAYYVGDTDIRYHIVQYDDWMMYLHHILQ